MYQQRKKNPPVKCNIFEHWYGAKLSGSVVLFTSLLGTWVCSMDPWISHNSQTQVPIQKICWDFLRSGRRSVFRAGCSHTDFYKYMNKIIYHWCRLKEPPSSNKWKRRSRTAPSAVQAVLCHSPHRLFDSALKAEASCRDSLHSIFKVVYTPKQILFESCGHWHCQSCPFYCSTTTLLTPSHCYKTCLCWRNSFPAETQHKASTTLTEEAEVAIFQIIRCISKCTYSLSVFVKPILKLGFEMAENCMLGLSLRGWRGREGLSTVCSRNKEKGRVLFFKHLLLL